MECGIYKIVREYVFSTDLENKSCFFMQILFCITYKIIAKQCNKEQI
jgi:hypothetical protein